MILVTGASGNVGSALVKQLTDSGARVRVMTRDPARVARLQASECVVADLEDEASLQRALAGVQKVFLLTMSLDARQDESLLRVARRAGVEQVVRLSTIEASDACLSVGKWHREKDELLEASGLSWTILRPGMFMSNALHWLASIKSAGGVYFPGGRGPVAPIDPIDVARVAARALTEPGHSGQRYELTGPELTSTEGMVKTLSEVLGRPLKYRDVPIFLARFFMRRSGMDPRLASALGELALSLRRGEQARQTSTLLRIVGDSGGSFRAWCQRHKAAFE